MMTDKKAFVAVSAIWFERFLECSRVQGTELFPKSVWRFYHSLLNLGENELAIKDIIKDYYNSTWKPKLELAAEMECKRERISINNTSSRSVIYQENEAELIIELFEFITQTIQDSGVGWPTKEEMQTFTYSLE